MEPGVPFALLAATQLLAVGAFLGFAGYALRPPFRAPGRLGLAASLLLTVGSLAVAVADAVTGARLGPAADDALVAVQAAGLVAIALGLATRRAQVPVAALSVAPLGAAVPPSLVGVVGGVVAAGLALRHRDLPRIPLVTGLLTTGVALAMAPSARLHATAAVALLVVRIVGALGVLVAIGYAARTSVLAKVVAAIGVGVLITAIGAAAVVGTVVANQLASDQSRQLRQAAVGAANDLQSQADSSVQLAKQVTLCSAGLQLVACAGAVTEISTADAFAAVVGPTGVASLAKGSVDALDTTELQQLAATDAVKQALTPAGSKQVLGSGFVLLGGSHPQLVALGVASKTDPDTGKTSVVAYGVQVDATLLRQSRDRTTFDATVLTLPAGTPLASSLSTKASRVLAAASRSVLPSLTDPGVATSRLGQGATPPAAYVLLPSGTQRLAVLALSGSSDSVLHSQRTVLSLLFSALLGIGVLVAVGAYVLGRRAVEPVRRLTIAARKVGEGDLTIRPVATTNDEVGELASVFSAMTVSLEYLTDDLRTTAETEAATRARLGTVIDAMAEGLVVADAHGVVDLANPAAAALFGPLVGLDVDTVLVDLEGSPLTAGERWAETRRGPVPVAVAVAKLPDDRGTVHVVRDVTETHQLERAKTEFLSNVSHELRTPLTPIQGYADLLRRRELTPAQVRTMAESISEGARRMARVVGLVVDVAALDAGRVAATAEPVKPTAFLDGRIADWKKRDPAAEIKRRVSAGTPDLLADPVWLARAVDELVDNALHHGRTAVTLLAAQTDDGRVAISVKDNGPGLEDTAGLFEDFAQVDGSATRSRDGLGLGLSFVQRVCAVLGAHASVVSKPGAGAVFTLDVPAAIPAPRRRSGRSRTGGSTRSRR